MTAGVGTEIRVVFAVFNGLAMAVFTGCPVTLMPEDEIIPVVASGFSLDQRRYDVFRYFTFMDDDGDTVTEGAIDPYLLARIILVPAAVTTKTAGRIVVSTVIGKGPPGHVRIAEAGIDQQV